MNSPIRLRSRWARLLVAVLIMGESIDAAAMLMKPSYAGQGAHALLFLLAGVTLCALFCGFRIAALAIVVSVVFEKISLGIPIFPLGAESLQGLVELGVFVLVACLVAMAVANLRTVHERAELELLKSAAAIRARETVLSVVSHDLRNPLCAVQISSDLLSRAGPEAERLGKLIRRSTEQMDRMIQDIQDFGNLETGRLVLDMSRLSIESLFAESRRMLEPIALSKGQRLLFECESAGLEVRADGNRISRALANLVAGAGRATPRGGTIQVRARPSSDGVVIAVKDEGQGLPLRKIQEIFERSERVKRPSDQRLGLELWIASGLVRAHGGRVTVKCLEGSGNEFSFTLPAPASSSSRAAPERLQA